MLCNVVVDVVENIKSTLYYIIYNNRNKMGASHKTTARNIQKSNSFKNLTIKSGVKCDKPEILEIKNFIKRFIYRYGIMGKEKFTKYLKETISQDLIINKLSGNEMVCSYDVKKKNLLILAIEKNYTLPESIQKLMETYIILPLLYLGDFKHLKYYLSIKENRAFIKKVANVIDTIFDTAVNKIKDTKFMENHLEKFANEASINAEIVKIERVKTLKRVINDIKYFLGYDGCYILRKMIESKTDSFIMLNKLITAITELKKETKTKTGNKAATMTAKGLVKTDILTSLNNSDLGIDIVDLMVTTLEKDGKILHHYLFENKDVAIVKRLYDLHKLVEENQGFYNKYSFTISPLQKYILTFFSNESIYKKLPEKNKPIFGFLKGELDKCMKNEFCQESLVQKNNIDKTEEKTPAIPEDEDF
jgi:hypothetical protein